MNRMTLSQRILPGRARRAAGAILVGLLLPASALLAAPENYKIDPEHSAVGFSIRHLFSNVPGRFTKFEGKMVIDRDDFTKSSVEVSIDAASIDTNEPTRDAHLRSADFLDVDRYPEITYSSTGLTAAGSDRWTVHGELTLHGVVRPVDLDLAYLGTGADPWGGTRAAFRATTELHREDFAMNYNQVLQAGIAAIGTTLRVELDIQAVQGETLPQA